LHLCFQTVFIQTAKWWQIFLGASWKVATFLQKQTLKEGSPTECFKFVSFWSPHCKKLTTTLKPNLDGVQGSKFLWTNLASFEVNWILELKPSLGPYSCILVLQIMSCVFSFGSEQIDFPSKLVPCISLAWICHFWVLDSHVKTMGPIYDSHYPIGLLYFIEPWSAI
jgi:hypothetical protein